MLQEVDDSKGKHVTQVTHVRCTNYNNKVRTFVIYYAFHQKACMPCLTYVSFVNSRSLYQGVGYNFLFLLYVSALESWISFQLLQESSSLHDVAKPFPIVVSIGKGIKLLGFQLRKDYDKNSQIVSCFSKEVFDVSIQL